MQHLNYKPSWDVTLLQMLNGGQHPPLLDRFMVAVSTAGNAGLIFWLGLGALYLLGKGPQRRGALLGFAALLTTLVLGDGLLKHLFFRPRPAEALGTDMVHTLVHAHGSSFPSGHTAAAFAVAVAVGGRSPAWALPLLGAAFLMGVSRIYLGVHFPSDVLAGMVLGGTVGLVVLWLEPYLPGDRA